MHSNFIRSLIASAALTAALASVSAHAERVSVTPLVTDNQAAHPAQITDTDLVNAWGISHSPTGPFWISSNGAGVSTLYQVNPATQVTTKLPLVVSIPGDGSVSGQAFNGSSGFNGDAFLFVSEDGTVSGWRSSLGTSAEQLSAASSSHLYKGITIGAIGSDQYAYIANFGSGAIDIFKGSAGAADLTGHFTDPTLPSGYAPFNIQNLAGTLYVTYAQQVAGSRDEAHGSGLGFVSAFDLNGNFLRRIASEGTLNAPWGLALAPSSFGDVAGSLLVGNFGDGTINAFNPLTGSFLGQLRAADGSVLAIDGLWGLIVGNDGNAGSSQRVYFTAGPDDESHGLFGVLTAVPEPATWATMVIGFGMLGFAMRRRQKISVSLRHAG